MPSLPALRFPSTAKATSSSSRPQKDPGGTWRWPLWAASLAAVAAVPRSPALEPPSLSCMQLESLNTGDTKL